MKLKTILSESSNDKYIKLNTDHPEYMNLAAKWWSDLSFNEMKDMYNKYFPFQKQDIGNMKQPPVRHKSLDMLAIWYNWKQKNSKLSENILYENELKYTKEERNALIQSIREFHQYKNDVFRTGKLKEICEQIGQIVTAATGMTLSETDGWFDKNTVMRDNSRLEQSYKIFEKTATEIAQLQQRLEAAYEDIGSGLKRYY